MRSLHSLVPLHFASLFKGYVQTSKESWYSIASDLFSRSCLPVFFDLVSKWSSYVSFFCAFVPASCLSDTCSFWRYCTKAYTWTRLRCRASAPEDLWLLHWKVWNKLNALRSIQFDRLRWAWCRYLIRWECVWRSKYVYGICRLCWRNDLRYISILCWRMRELLLRWRWRL